MLEYMTPSAELVEAIKRLREDGYTIAMDKASAGPCPRDFVGLLDIIAIDMGQEPDVVEAVAAAAKNCPDSPLLLAKKVESLRLLDHARQLGCSLFQGFFFQEPTTISNKKISSGELVRLKLFDIIEQPDPDFQALAATIESDVALSYRLLTFLNSAAFSFTQKITSIRQAVVLIGWRQLRGWLRLVLLTDMAPPAKTQELAFLSAQRAKFLELAAQDLHALELADTLFLLGLFSLLEPMLDAPMQDIVAHLPLADELQHALCRRQSELTPWLTLVETIEKSRWDDVDAAMERLGLDADKLAEAYQRSIEWANTFFGSL
jgi:EAL and modified HD-GYP domain-containing signal transduction protein